jgi:hypothetical protein
MKSKDIFLFLDIDGVLNSKQFIATVKDHPGLPDDLFYPLDPEKVSHLNEIISLLEADNFVVSIILSSYWRLDFTIDEMTDLLRAKGYSGPDIADCTALGAHRGQEIYDYYHVHRKIVKNILILDDDSDVYKISGFSGRWVFTDWENGLLKNHIPYAIKCANNALE